MRKKILGQCRSIKSPALEVVERFAIQMAEIHVKSGNLGEKSWCGLLNDFGIRRAIGGRAFCNFRRECRVKMFMLPMVGYGYFV